MMQEIAVNHFYANFYKDYYIISQHLVCQVNYNY